MATAIHSQFLEEVGSSANVAEMSVASARHHVTDLHVAGEAVPEPGSYWVWHSHHRPVHAAKVRFTVFPSCAKCGDAVRYLRMDEGESATEWLRRDPDFRHKLVHRGRRRS